MSLATSIQSIKASLPRHAAGLAKARARHAALAPYATVDAILYALSEGSPTSASERGAIVAALVFEHQLAKGELYQGLLLVAFEGALVALRAKLKNKKSEDFDQLVLLCFLEALATPRLVRAGDFAPIALMLLTKELVSRERRTLRREIHPESLEAREDDGIEEASLEKEEPRHPKAEEEVARLLGTIESDRTRDLLLATVAGNESLRDYVARCMPGLCPKERDSVYECLRSQRRAALRRLRMLATDVADETPEAA